MRQLSLNPILLLDDSLSFRFAEALKAATGYDIRSVRSEWPDRNPRIHPVTDEEIIPRLAELALHKGVWITSDWDSRKAHAKLIVASTISVLWMYQPNNAALKALQELQLLSLVLEPVWNLVAGAETPIHLKASLNVRKPKLERLLGSLYDKQLHWARIVL